VASSYLLRRRICAGAITARETRFAESPVRFVVRSQKDAPVISWPGRAFEPVLLMSGRLVMGGGGVLMRLGGVLVGLARVFVSGFVVAGGMVLCCCVVGLCSVLVVLGCLLVCVVCHVRISL